MISDYSRVAELSAAAYDSAGAGQAQYEKTLDSLQSKQEKLKNSWNEFLMGIANQEAIKTVVDLLNGLLGTLNKIISFLSGNSGLLKTALSLLTVAGGFKLGKSILGQTGVANSGIWSALFGGKNDAVKQGQETGKGFVSGFKQATSKEDFLKDYFSWKKEYTVDLSKNLDEEFTNKNYHFDFSGATKEQLEGQKKAVIGMLSQGNAEMQNLGTNFSSLWDAGKYDEAQEALKKCNVYLKMTGEEAQKAGIQVKQTSANFQMMAQSTAMAATALMACGGLFDSLGLEDLGVIFTSLGTAMMGIIPIITMVQNAMIAGATSVSVAIKNIPIIGWIAAIISALISLIQMIVHFAKKYKAETPEEKLERMQEATEEARKAAEEAKDAYDELFSVKTDYQEKVDALDKLVQGTDEWKRALIEANQAVIELMQNYPELAEGNYIKRLENGLLTIDDSFWDKQMDGQYKALQNATAIELLSSSEERKQELKMQANNLRDTIKERRGGAWSANAYNESLGLEDYDQLVSNLLEQFRTQDLDSLIGTLTDPSKNNEVLPQIEKLLEEGKQVSLSDFGRVAQTWAGNEQGMTDTYFFMSDEASEILGKFDVQLYDLLDILPDVASGFYELQNAMEAQYNSLKASNQQIIESKVTPSILKREGGQDFIDIFSGRLAEDGVYEDASQNIIKKMTLGKKDNFSENAYLADLAKSYGVSSKISDKKSNAENLGVLYEAMFGQIVPEDKTSDTEWLTAQIASVAVYEESADAVEKLTEALQKFDSQTQKNIAGILKGGKELSSFELNKLTPEAINDYLVGLMQNAGYTMDRKDEFAKTMQYDSYEAMVEDIQNQIKETQQLWKSIRGNFIEANIDRKGHSGLFSTSIEKAGIDLETYKALTDVYTKIGIKDESGEAQTLFGQVVGQIFNDNSLSDGIKENFKNLLSTYDLSDYDEVKKFLLELENTGTATEDQIKDLEKALLELGQATKKIDLSKLATQIKDTLDLADDLETRDRSEGLTQEEVETLVNAGVAENSDFYFTGQEFVPIESSMDVLADAIRKNTDAIIQNTLAQLQKQIREGEQFSDMIKNAEEEIGNDQGKIESLNRIKNNENVSTADAKVLKIMMGDEDASDAEALAWYNANIDSYLKLGDNIAQLADYGEKMIQASAYQMEPQELLNQLNSGAFVTNMNEKVAGYGSNFTEEKADKLLEDQISIHNLKDNVDGLITAYRKSGAEIGDNTRVMKVHALQVDKDEKEVKSLCETVEDAKDAFLAENKAVLAGAIGSQEYRDALEKITNKGKEVFGEAFTSEYVQNNSELVSQLAKGGEVGEQAFIKIQKAMMNASLGSKSLIEELDEKYESFVSDVNNANLRLDLYGTADLTNIYNALFEVYKDADKAKQKLEEITGASITTSVVYKTEMMPKVLAESAGYEYTTTNGGGKLVKAKVPQIHIVGTRKDYTGSGFSPSSSGSGSSSKDKAWENPYDELYNLTEKINEALRQREKLEREYDRILERRGSTFKELRANYNAQLASLEKEIQYQKELQAGRKRQLDKIGSEKHADDDGNLKTFSEWGIMQYATYDQKAGVIRIDWDAIDKITDEEKGGAIEAYISRLEELQDQFEETQETIEDMQDTVEELKKDQMQEYLDFEQSVYDALVNQQQKLIDNFQEISDKIADSNSEILDSIQESIDLERQIRDNTKTEQDINEKEARLAYLRRDTSNSNLLEIKQLEEELADNRQAYGDTLIDQQLDRLSKQNEDAQKAREKQIELMQAQLDYASENGEFWNQAYELIQSGFAVDGSLNQASQLWTLLQEDQGWNGLSKFGQLNWQEEISKAIIAASQGYANWNMYKAEQVDKSLVLPDGTKLSFDGSKWKDSQGNVYNGVDFDSNANQFTYSSVDYVNPQPSPGSDSGSTSAPEKETVSVGSRFNASGALIYSYPGSKGYRQYFADEPYYTAIGESGDYWLARWYKSSGGVSGYFKKGDVKAYKTGGLADSTGPAWLDGTPSKPELVLNAQDTKNFIQLRDILGSFMRDTASTSFANSGTSYFDIDINVDEIGNDYDVDRLAERVKEQINADSRYRNVNSISFLR